MLPRILFEARADAMTLPIPMVGSWVGLALLVLAGCGGGTASGTDPSLSVDADHDGYTTQVDCDDNNAAVHPGVVEICGDGVDQDCNGADEACAACGDAAVLSTGCTCGSARQTSGICCGDTWHAGGFCCGSGWQASDCVSCGDGDGDGYADALCGGDDCNDAASGVHPGAVDVCGDGVDQDCSGGDLVCAACTQGAVAAAGCVCGTTRHDTGYCCSDVWQSGACSPPVEIPSSIAAVADACANEPMRGIVYYYCDCGTGAQAGCTAGNDANAGTDAAAPRRTIGNAASRFGALAVNDTVALCKGGAFDSAGGLSIGSSRCGAGVACNDLREYAPTIFAGTAKPIINNAAGELNLFSFMGNKGGVRILNLALRGNIDTVSHRNNGFFFYAGAHDVTMCNLEMDAFDIAVYNESNAGNTNHIAVTGSTIRNSRVQGYLGSGDNAAINYNYWDGNGSSTVFDHTIYLSSDSAWVTNVQVIGNDVHGQYGSTCNGVAIVGHVAIDGFRFEHNTIAIDAAAATGGCYGVGFGPANQAGGKYLRNANFSGNLIKNGGNTGFSVENCPDCIVENNVIVQNWPAAYETTGMWISSNSVRPEDDVGDRALVRNNTIWFGPNANKGGIGLGFGSLGTGHTVINNTITYTAASATPNGFWCYDYTAPPPSAFSVIDNNHCFSNASYEWMNGAGNLATWQASAAPFDAHSIGGAPLFVAAGSDFTPGVGSPLIIAGRATSAPAVDINGTARPSPPSIGALEAP